MSSGLIEEVFGRIDESKEDLADLALELGNTYGPLGNEEPTARAACTSGTATTGWRRISFP